VRRRKEARVGRGVAIEVLRKDLLSQVTVSLF